MSATLAWILGVLFIIALVAFIVFLILYLSKGKSGNPKKDLTITGLKYKLNNSSTILTATWDSVGNSEDLIFLYADITPVNLDPEGKPIKTVIGNGPVSGTSKMISLPNLKPETTYYVVLVVTNPNITGHNAEPDIIFTGTIPAGNFRISEISTDGAITLGSDAKTVTYVPGTNKTDTSDLWTYDQTNFILKGTPLGINSTQGDVILYNNNGVLSADLATSSTITKENSEWGYGEDGINLWCLKNKPGTCMSLNIPISGMPPLIQVVANSTTKWKNIVQASAM